LDIIYRNPLLNLVCLALLVILDNLVPLDNILANLVLMPLDNILANLVLIQALILLSLQAVLLERKVIRKARIKKMMQRRIRKKPRKPRRSKKKQPKPLDGKISLIKLTRTGVEP